MKKTGLQWLAPMILGGAMFSGTAAADSFFKVSVTNITKGAVFTPVMVATTRKGDTFFQLGEAASDALETLAETGNPVLLQGSLDAHDVTNSDPHFVGPGETVTQFVETRGPYKYISVAAMVIPTNDVFFAVNGVAGPKGKKTITVTSPAYDAGTELNDELCASLPGPTCDGDPGPVSDNGEGFVYISPGILGVGDLDADMFAWNDPIAVIQITRVKEHDDDDDEGEE